MYPKLTKLPRTTGPSAKERNSTRSPICRTRSGKTTLCRRSFRGPTSWAPDHFVQCFYAR